MDLATMRTRVRRDLHDEDGASYRWTDAELDRHLDRAVRELSLAVPLQSKATLTTAAGSRDLSLASLTGLVQVEAVEYPVDKYPPQFAQFSLWGNTLTLLVDSAPSGAASAYLYYGKLHTLDATSSTIPAPLEDLVALGAAAYAALEWASYATNRVNLGGEETWRHYLAWGQDRLGDFARGLAKGSRKNAVRLRRLYRPATILPGQSSDPGP